ncbi:MAG: TIM barrel protein [Pseudomonadota bacterium]
MTLPISANLGFLWVDIPLPDRIRAAKAASFDAVECHWPYEHPAEEIAAVLDETGLRMLGINTILGPEGLFGLAAVPGFEADAKAAIDQAVTYAAAINARHINVVGGLTDGGAEAEAVFRANLAYAATEAANHDLMIVIEALNPRSVPGAHVWSQDAALETVKAVGAPNLKIMLDFFHAQIVQGDLETLFRENLDLIGHIQFAAVHDRGEPDEGELNFPYIFAALETAGYTDHIGAEYKPRGESVEAGLGWMKAYRNT